MKTIPNTEELAEELYEAYCASVGGLAWNGDVLPSWREFRADPKKRKQSDAWVAVASKAMDILIG